MNESRLKLETMKYLSIAICSLAFAVHCGAAEKPNILFIAVDDLRPELGCYGSPIAVSPNFDALAKEGLLFNRAYCQQAICRPSRASLMTGARPETTGLFHNYVSLRELQPNIVTLPQQLIAHGYDAAYCGKIFHLGDNDEGVSWNRESVKWLQGIKKPKSGFALPENQKIQTEDRTEMIAKYGDAAKRGLASGPAYESADVPDHAYVDGYETLRAIETMKQMVKEGDKPFFMALGFKKPHLNWVAPKKYWDMYDRDKIPMASETEAPLNGAAMGLHASFELRTRSGIPKTGDLDPELARTLKHAYLACVSYVDAQFGKMVAALEEAGVRDNTIIVVWGDHGWHLGDMGVWGKATNYEIATRVPMMIWSPTMKSHGAKTDALVELVDIYPTLCELAGVPIPDHVEGHSFVPLMDDPDQPWKKAAFSQYPNPALREWAANPLSPAMRETWFGPLIQEVETRIQQQQGDRWDRELFEQHLMGYTMRTDRYRLVLWRDHREPNVDPVFVELFDHQTDPLETKNVAGDFPDLVESLSQQLNLGWEAAL
ncbi:Choline-sulfatase [Rubripirellula lacrimiformis]|uniref:Choline-sulfatase n=2 Tax=Rubripirellula lacrimiformis TaxID=1930273 RepID=A0A517NCS8_9BACT|nr:Choline-sulfatase [Rubripirellula lacrimiformis]